MGCKLVRKKKKGKRERDEGGKEEGKEREANKIVVGRWDTRKMDEKVGV